MEGTSLIFRSTRAIVALGVALAIAGCTLLADLGSLMEGEGPEERSTDPLAPDSSVADVTSEPPPDADADADASSGSGVDGSAPRSAYEAEVLADGPIAYFRFEEAGGLNAMDDQGGPPARYSATGVIYAAPGGFAGSRGVMLDGITGRVSVGPRFSFTGKAAFSIELWVSSYIVDTAVRFLVSWRSRGGGSTGLALLSSSNETLFERKVPEGAGYAPGGALDIARFTHLVAAFDGQRAHLYVDGELAGQGAAEGEMPAPSNADLVVGDLPSGSSTKLFGVIDDLAIYDKALSPERVRAHFAAAVP